LNKEKLFPIDSTWNFEKLVAQRKTPGHEDAKKQHPETHIDTADSAAKSTKTPTIRPELTTTEKSLDEYDKKQLRNYIHQVLAKWKQDHQNDKLITIADLMHDELAQDEPA
jgi:hypothetical protein